jgi:hypothetical protein
MSASAFHFPLRRLRTEVTWLQREFIHAAVPPSGDHDKQLACEMSVIRLHDAWARFCRELIILSAFGHTTTLGGVQLKPSHSAISGRHSVVPVLLSTYKRKKTEPRWADAAECIDAAYRLSIMNLSTVAAALGATNSPADEIRRIRNFYAHRKQETAHRAIATNLFSTNSRPASFELARYTNGGYRVIESWTRGLLIVATAAAQ